VLVVVVVVMDRRTELGRLSRDGVMGDSGPSKGVDEKEEEEGAEFALSLTEDWTAKLKGLDACFSAQPPRELSDFLTRGLYCQSPSCGYYSTSI